MEIKAFSEKISVFLKKYRYITLVVLIGLILLVLPSNKTDEAEAVITVESHDQEEPDMQKTLSQLLSKIAGAGEVEVLLTFQAGEERVFQTNESQNTDQDSQNIQTDTVTVTDSDRNQSGLVKKVLAPTYRGAIVVCQGADNPSVQLAIVEAVSNATGLSTNRISVLKMK